VWRNKYLAIKFGVQKRKQDKLEAIAKLHMGADALEDRMRDEAGLGRAAADSQPLHSFIKVTQQRPSH
jgi:hypothetical protein